MSTRANSLKRSAVERYSGLDTRYVVIVEGSTDKLFFKPMLYNYTIISPGKHGESISNAFYIKDSDGKKNISSKRYEYYLKFFYDLEAMVVSTELFNKVHRESMRKFPKTESLLDNEEFKMKFMRGHKEAAWRFYQNSKKRVDLFDGIRFFDQREGKLVLPNHKKIPPKLLREAESFFLNEQYCEFVTNMNFQVTGKLYLRMLIMYEIIIFKQSHFGLENPSHGGFIAGKNTPYSKSFYEFMKKVQSEYSNVNSEKSHSSECVDGWLTKGNHDLKKELKSLRRSISSFFINQV